jgi:hypothetical protein
MFSLLVVFPLLSVAVDEFAFKPVTIGTLYQPLILRSPKIEYTNNEELGPMPTFSAELFGTGEDTWISVTISCRITGITFKGEKVSKSIVRLLPSGVRDGKKPPITAIQSAIVRYRFLPDDRFDLLKSGQISCETTNGELVLPKGQKSRYEEERIAARKAADLEAEAERIAAEKERAALKASCEGLRRRLANTKISDLTVSQSDALNACRVLGF